MAGIVSGLVQNLLEKLSAKVYEEIYLACTIKSDLKKLESTVSLIDNVLLDAEEKQEHDRELSHWLKELKYALYDAEDVFDEFECEALRRKMVKQWTTTKKVGHFFQMNSNSCIFSFKMARRIKEINERLDDIAATSKKFDLIKKEATYLTHTTREMTHSFVNASDVFGRDNDKERIIQLLILSNDNEEPDVISLVGLGGLGKTTLAKLVYNDKRIDEHFTKKMWICVSMDFDIRRLTREILSSAVNAEASDNFSMDQLQGKLREKLFNCRFLLVLDDVWNENPNKWRDLRQFLMVGAKGSKILITTRMDSVAKVMSKDKLKYELKAISKEESWSLFANCVFGDKNEREIPDYLKKIGEGILEKCKGVPLAIRSLGSLLYLNPSVQDWEYIRNSELWQLDRKEDDILTVLKLSYNLMPSYLKPCFVYCALFPKGHLYRSDHVIQLWIAHGMLHSEKGNEELEDIGKQYLRELCSRSFLIQEAVKEDYHFLSTFKMHDIFHDLALSIAQDNYLTTESNVTTSSPDNLRHLYVSHLGEIIFLPIQTLKKVRSLVCDQGLEGPDKQYSFFSNSFPKFHFLRVLEIQLLCESLPDGISGLKHLRYLNLGGSVFLQSLPNSICDLQNLQTLILEDCFSLKALPKDIRNLINLRYLWIATEQMSLKDVEIESLSNLRLLAITNGTEPEWVDRENDGDDINQKDNIQSRLQVLHLRLLVSLVALPPWFRRFANTLRHVEIIDCFHLAGLPAWFAELSSVETLVLVECYGLSSLPEGIEHLSTLTELIIRNCGELSSRCKPKTGDEWHKIAHVPMVEIDGRIISNYGLL